MQARITLAILVGGLIFTTSCGGGDSFEQLEDADEPTDIFDDTRIQIVKLSFSQENYWDSLLYFRTLMDSLERVVYLAADVSINEHSFSPCGIRFKGESSYSHTLNKKLPFKISLNRFVDTLRYKGHKKINLTNIFKDPSMMREKLMLDFLRKKNLPAPRSSFAKVYINEQYWGLYLLTEQIDDEFLEDNFGNEDGNLYKGEPDPKLIYFGEDLKLYERKYVKDNNKKEYDWTDLIMLIRAINNPVDGSYHSRLDSVLDTEGMLRQWAITNMFVNVDAYNMIYAHNFYLYHNEATDKFNWVGVDYNYGFAAWNPKYNLEEVYNFDILYVRQPDSLVPLARTTLGQSLHYRKQYLKIYRELLADFDEEWFQKKIDTYHELIGEAVRDEPEKTYTYEEYETNLQRTVGNPLDPGAFSPGLIEFVRKRKKSVETQLEALSQD